MALVVLLVLVLGLLLILPLLSTSPSTSRPLLLSTKGRYAPVVRLLLSSLLLRGGPSIY